MEPRLVFILVLAFPFLLAVVLAVAGSRLGRRSGALALSAPVLGCAGLAWLASAVPLRPGTRFAWAWVPSLGIEFSFVLDGLSLFFGLVVCGMGVLVFQYARHYLDDEDFAHGRFFACLTLFMGSMLGAVLSNHLLVLFLFWELTGVSSFLLIGFLHREEASRTGARQALLVTAFTGMALLGGFLLVQHAAGTADFLDLREAGLPFREHGAALTAAFVLIALGAFGKSAQIPFHFWLPNAMAAPTPVSAYLHSATMVKLGVFLLARVYPLFAGEEAWSRLLAPVGHATLALAALFAVLSHDLKAILAWTTVSALGYFVGYYGQGVAAGVANDRLHLVNHVLYKGCLFMVAGVVAHATGRRDIRELGGLLRRMPLTGFAAGVACLALAGLPGTTGFLAKESALHDALAAADRSPMHGFFAGCLLFAGVCSVAVALRFFSGVFLGREPAGLDEQWHAPSVALQAPAALLAGACLVFGLWPAGLEAALHPLETPGLHAGTGHLALWHGVTPALVASTGILLAGIGLFLALRPVAGRLGVPRMLRLDLAFEASLRVLERIASRVTRAARTDRPVDYLPLVLGFSALVVGAALANALWGPGGDGIAPLLKGLPPVHWLPALVAALTTLAVVGAVVLKRWSTRLLCLSVAGFLVCFYFVLFQAPDLALTQILVEVISLFLVLILLGRFPAAAELGELHSRSSPSTRALHLAIAAGVGVCMTTGLLLTLAHPPPERLGDLLLEASVPLAHGTNAVNTALIDFRGFDTLGEITVLVVASLGGLGLLMRYKRSAEEFRAGPHDAPGFGSFKVTAEDAEEEDREGT